MRELANEMSEEAKNNVINSQAAKQCEKAALMSGVSAAIAGVGAGIAGYASLHARAGEKIAKQQSTQMPGDTKDFSNAELELTQGVRYQDGSIRDGESILPEKLLTDDGRFRI